MIMTVIMLTLLGLACSVVLAVAARAFYVYEDPIVAAIADRLPGANCGGCGFAGCAATADAIAHRRAPVNACVVGGVEVAQAVAEIVGEKAVAREPQFHSTSCLYGVVEADPKYTYNGVMDCEAAVMLYGGSKLCPIGCIGLGSCVKSCQFSALSMGENHLPVVNEKRCVGCGACVKACPKNIITLTSATQRILGEYRTDECTAPCQRTCPTGINIRDYIREIRDGDYPQALRVIKEKCPLPLVCGYICPAPCELECRRNLLDEGVSINGLKRFVADYERTTGKHIQPYKAPSNERKVALIGGGAEGLTAGYYLARLGYQTLVLEAKPQLGGILRYVITEDRLPREVLDHDIQGIIAMGVKARTHQVMGRDFTVSSLLKEGFDAVLLMVGGLDSRKILHPTGTMNPHPFRGLILLLDFLSLIAQGRPIPVGQHVVVAHSRPLALEVARNCLKMGAKKVTLVSPLALEDLPPELRGGKDLSNQGIEVRPSTIVAAVGGIGDGLSRIALESIDPRGSLLGRQEIVEADTLIASEARYPELVFVRGGEEPDPAHDQIPWQTIETFRTYPGGNSQGIFASPEPGRVSDASAVVRAILSGRRLARAVHQHLSEGVVTPIDRLAWEAKSILNVSEVHHVLSAERQQPKQCDVEGDAKAAWVLPKELPGLDEEAALREANRCLRCGLICYEKTGARESASNPVTAS